MFFTTKAVAITRRVGWRRWRHIGLVHAPRHWLQSTHAQATQMSANPCSLKHRRVLIWSLLRLICRLSRSHSLSICIQDIGESHAWLCTATPLPTPTHTHTHTPTPRSQLPGVKTQSQPYCLSGTTRCYF